MKVEATWITWVGATDAAISQLREVCCTDATAAFKLRFAVCRSHRWTSTPRLVSLYPSPTAALAVPARALHQRTAGSCKSEILVIKSRPDALNSSGVCPPIICSRPASDSRAMFSLLAMRRCTRVLTTVTCGEAPSVSDHHRSSGTRRARDLHGHQHRQPVFYWGFPVSHHDTPRLVAMSHPS